MIPWYWGVPTFLAGFTVAALLAASGRAEARLDLIEEVQRYRNEVKALRQMLGGEIERREG